MSNSAMPSAPPARLASPQTIRKLRTSCLGAYYHATIPYRMWRSARRAAEALRR